MVANMLTEKLADPIAPKIGDPILASAGKDRGVRQDEIMLVNAALEIAENVVPARDVETEV